MWIFIIIVIFSLQILTVRSEAVTAAALAFQAAKDHLFCLVKSIHYLAVLASERHAAGLYINAPYRLKQRRFQNQELT